MAIKTYNAKRKFDKTPEPRGIKDRKTIGKRIFVIQKHNARRLHYDFRLELDGVLKSWAVPKGPSLNPKDKRLAMQVEDHPLSYATFEGIIPKNNYGAGEVIVWDAGTYEPRVDYKNDKESEKILKDELDKGRLTIVLHGEKLKGEFALARMKENQWLLIKKRDEYASLEDVTNQTYSVLSKKSLTLDKKLTGKSKDKIPTNVRPMLATLVKEPFDDPNWIFEIKWDGYRAISEVTKKGIRIYSRNNLEFNSRYPQIVNALKEVNHDVVFDGEIVAVDEKGRTSFELMQNASKNPDITLLYYVFDLLYLDGKNLEREPLMERRKLLREILPEKSLIRFSEDVEEKGVKFFSEIKKRNLEGIIAKEKNSLYLEGVRGNSWLKIKTELRQEAIICGITEPRGSRNKFGALVLGVYDGGKLKYIGHTGGGFNENSLKDVYKKIKPLIVSKSSFDPVPKTNMPATWLKPSLVCEVKFTEWTKEGQMRHPIFLGLRLDKKAKEVVIEKTKPVEETKVGAEKEIDGGKVKLTNLDKIYWPKEKITKGDLLDYYNKISDFILPYLKDRPENLNRHPGGISKPGFYQKDLAELKVPTFVKTAEIFSESNDKNIRYLVCNNKETLLYMANLGCVEINPWNSRVSSLENPDYMIIDLDPGKNTFEEVIKVAKVLHKILEMSCEKSFCKTSGQTGLHVYIPLGAKYNYEQVRKFSELVVRIVHKKLPELTSIERNPTKRKNKIYLDYLQNRYGQTLAAPYSVRPVPGAPVSTPLKWSEVKEGLDPKKFTMRTILNRLEKVGDLWAPVLKEKVDLVEAIKCLQESKLGLS